MEQALAGTNSSFWHGRRIAVSQRVRRAEPRSGVQSPMSPTKSLYVGNIPYETTDAELNQIFRDLSGVTDVRVAVDRTTGWPRGFAHADFTDIEAAQQAREKLSAMSIGGRALRVDFAAEAQKKTPTGVSSSNDFTSAP